MLQHMMNKFNIKMQSTLGTVVLLAMLFGAFALANPLSNFHELELELKRHQDFLHNISTVVEIDLDKEQIEYCQQFGSHFLNKSDLWPTVMAKCIHPTVFIPQDQQLPAFFNRIRNQTQLKAVELYEKCSGLVKNPCEQNDWINVKKCVSDQFTRNDNDGQFFMLAIGNGNGNGNGFTSKEYKTSNEKILLLSWLDIPGFSKCTAQNVRPS